ncbi:hypothetical protein W97_08209 [Coniosporium apollinis CBS 100218]|uniref:SprT-like domain-containing protein n=1 Tax=Coniosporium apollinis (strain CBS 100218) TaxID=1168221 RepID=R7Z4T3_CONA1|nr:uncharacterized protein W97_08209 [Coniosporium apollinis CBS 100218]EON68951.1 hypothetical protein W97_08209 [Coniosporium apollinis CBS 100218]
MARLRTPDESDDELPDIRGLILTAKAEKETRTPSLKGDTRNNYANTRIDPRKARVKAEEEEDRVPTARKPARLADNASANLILKTPRARAGETPVKRQRALKAAQPNALLLPISSAIAEAPSARKKRGETVRPQAIRHTPRRAVKEAVEYRSAAPCSSDSEHDISEVTWCGSEESEVDSDVEKRWRSSTKPARTTARETLQTTPATDSRVFAEDGGPKPSTLWDNIIDLTTPRPAKAAETSLIQPVPQPSTASRPSSSSSTDQAAILHFSPPRLRSPRKAPPRPSTPPPPNSPPRSRLTSPSKKNRIPQRQSLRESIDAFWSAGVVNEWNDQYSPRKTLQPPKKSRNRLPDPDLDDDEAGHTTPSTRSPAKKTQSPTKRTKAAISARKAWEAEKVSLAESAIRELDDAVTQGRISALSAATGGIRIVWSKKLNTTAGRANWRREGTATKPFAAEAGGGTATKTYIHHATIELAEKVIDGPDRLLNTLAHEFCHLATFMLSNVRDNPHGKEFKSWAAKVEAAFRGRYPDLKISTRHAYEIEYKYVWECEGCGTEFKRHSRSVDPARQSCGGCKGRLVQVRPAPRKAGGGKGEYQIFVKEKFRAVKKENPGLGVSEVMEVLGRMYRERKEAGGADVRAEGTGDGGAVEGDGLDAVVAQLEVVTLDD